MFRLIAVLLFGATLSAQIAPAPAPDARQLASLFGSAFTVDPKFPVITADLDRDGKEDAVVVVSTENPLLDEIEFGYKVVDPYNTYFGFGDPKVTAQFSAQEINPRVLLVVHNWRAPVRKFAIINIQFDKVSVGRFIPKTAKKPIASIRAEDRTGMKQDVY
jgi:hypothetical protein